MTKGDETRERIIERAFLLSGRDGLNGLSIGALAAELGMSKSGLFAHFGSKEDLQLAVLHHAADRFTDGVIKPSFKSARGIPRIKALFENWVAWAPMRGTPVVVSSTRRPVSSMISPERLAIICATHKIALQQSIARAAKIAVEEGHFKKNLDCEQFAFEAHGIVYALNLSFRLLKDPKAIKRARTALDRLIEFAST